MTTRSTSRTSRRQMARWMGIAPAVAIAAFGLSACSNGQTAATVTSTSVPAVWSANPNPPAAGAQGGGSEAAGGGSGAGQSGSASNGLTANIVNASGQPVGTATFTQNGDAVTVDVNVHGLKPGFHGLHVHSVGKCEAHSADPSDPAKIGDFLSAGPHFTTSAAQANNVLASGDLPSLEVTSNGTGHLVTTTGAFSLNDLKGGDGTAIVVHAEPDNFAHIPARYQVNGTPGADQETIATGDAGARVACGVISKG